MAKWLIVSAFIVCSGSAFAEPANAKLFACMDKQSFEINSDCMASIIDSNRKFEAAQAAIYEQADVAFERYVMATMQFDQQLMPINVVSKHDALHVKVDRF